MGVGLFAEFVLPRGPLHHVVAPVEHPGQFARAELRAVHAVVLAAPLSVVVGAGVGFVRLWVMGWKCSGAAPLAIRAMTGTSTPLSAPSATSTPASSPRWVCPSREDFPFPLESTVRGKFSAEPVFCDYRLYTGFGLL